MDPMNLKVGQQVTLTVANPVFGMRNRFASSVHVPAATSYTGMVVREKWYGDDRIGITTGDKQFKVRVIDVANIMAIGDAEIQPTVGVQTRRVWHVAGSKGNTYTVTEDGGRRECTCPGFTFRKDCKHVHEKREAA